MEAMEYQFDEMVTDAAEVQLQHRRPTTEYFHDYVLVTYWLEKVAPTKTLHDIGVHNVVAESDTPSHLHLSELTSDDRTGQVATRSLRPRRVLQGNATEAYGIPSRRPG